MPRRAPSRYGPAPGWRWVPAESPRMPYVLANAVLPGARSRRRSGHRRRATAGWADDGKVGKERFGMLGLRGEDDDIVRAEHGGLGGGERLDRQPDRRLWVVKLQAAGADRLEMGSAGDQPDVVPVLEEPAADGTADGAGAEDEVAHDAPVWCRAAGRRPPSLSMTAAACCPTSSSLRSRRRHRARVDELSTSMPPRISPIGNSGARTAQLRSRRDRRAAQRRSRAPRHPGRPSPLFMSPYSVTRLTTSDGAPRSAHERFRPALLVSGIARGSTASSTPCARARI